MAAGTSNYPNGWGMVGTDHMMSADEALNGMSAQPAYYGAYPTGAPSAAAVGGSPGAAHTRSGMGMPGLLIWGFLFVGLILSHTLTFELQE